MMMMTVINCGHTTKNRETGEDTNMTTSVSGHVSGEARKKLKQYQEGHELKNVSDTLEHLISHATIPELKTTPKEPDPNQSTLPGCDES